ncbi:titin-like [Rhagoletis pomonella]|uniref:titin-like n=1 Tax=Rhagoletis pomonella TaxID=28610 RepID=UPI0017802A50|nr:titin-like [Rhagoletis pomonella]
MELECDLSAIQNEDMLRRMWQQAEDIDQKKEIRSHLYKLRESRLRDLYQGDIMAGNFAKDPLNPSHGDSLVGQNFQSLKSKEVRDSVSPTQDLKFHSMTLNHPNTTGWDVQTSSEVSPDGRAYRTETLATTDGVEKINGGTAEFRGRNEQRASASHQGDDKNFVKKASESSDTHLQERVVVGDENSGRTEMKMSSTTTSSSSNVTSSSSTVEYGGGEPIDPAKYLVDKTSRQHPDQHHQYIQQQQQRQQQLQQEEFEQTKLYQQQQHEKRIQQQQQEQRQFSEEINRSRQESSTSRNVETQQKTEQNRRVVDVDKASPEYQQHVQYLMSQPGEIISNTVEYPKPNVKMITTVKRLPDGTIVKNKRYETEELQPAVESQRQRTTSTTSQNSTQHKSQQQRREQTEDNIYATQPSNTPRRPEQDVVDNAEPYARVPNQQHLVESRATDEATNVETKFSSVKKSSRRFSTETTSETVEEFSDQPPSTQAPGIRGKPSSRSPTRDFSTHGFPSVKSNRPTQEYPTERPHGAPQSQTPDFSTHGFPSVRPNKPTQQYASERPRPADVEHLTQQQPGAQVPHGFPAVRPNSNITTTKDGDIIIVSSESTRSSKYKTNAERIIETEVVVDGDTSGHPQRLTHPEPAAHPGRGFPAVKETSPGASSPRRPQPGEDFTTHGFPSVRSPTNSSPAAKPNSVQPVPSGVVNQDGNVTVVSSETKKTIKHNTNREHIIETEILGESDHHYSPAGLRQPDKITFPPTPQPSDFSTHGFPSVRDSAPTNDAYRRQGTPTRDHPSSPRKPKPSEDFSTHGFPSVKDSTPARGSTPSRDYPSSPRQHHPSEDFSTHGFPSVRTPSKTAPDYSTPSGGFPSTRDTNAPRLTPTQPRSTPTKTSTTTTDSSQRLISKERDVDASHRAFAASLRCSSPVDSIDHHRSSPRSSVSSTRTFRRDGREGSHDSETSRISSGTVTRTSPSKSVGKTVVTKQTVVKNRNVNGSNDTIDLTPQRPTKSPSPTKSVTTTTTTRTTTTRKSPGEVPKPVYPSDNQKSKPAENTFPIINEPLTITKTHFTANDASFLGNEVVEKPCIKKHFYKLGPSDSATHNVDEKSPYSPAPSNHIHRTHPKSKSQNRDVLEDANHEEPIHNQPLSSSIIEPKQRNRSPSGPKNSSPQTICQPLRNEPSVERRTVVRESTFENTDWQNTILDSDENQNPVKGDFPKRTELTDDSEHETPHRKGSPFDTSDYPGKRGVIGKQPINKNKTEHVTKVTTRVEKTQANVDIEDTKPTFVPKKPLDTTGKKPNEPLNRKPFEKHGAQPEEKAPTERKPTNMPTSPTRRTSDVTNSKTASTTFKTTRKENTQHIEDDRKPTRKPSDTNITSKSTHRQTPRPTDDSNRPNEPAYGNRNKKTPIDNKQSTDRRPETSSTRKIIESETFNTTIKSERNGETYSIEIDDQSEEPELVRPANEKTVDKKKPIEKRPLEKDYVRNDHSPHRTTSDKSNFYTSKITVDTVKTRKSNVSPTRKPEDIKTTEPVQKKPTKDEPSKQPKGAKLTKPANFGVTHTSPEYTRPAPTVDNESELSDVEHSPTDKGPARKPILNASKPVHISDDEDQDRIFTTTTIKTVRLDEPKSANPIVTDETRRVEELFNKTDRTKITNNVNEEFITIERQVKDKFPVNNIPTNDSSGLAPNSPDYCKPTTKKPIEPTKTTDKQKPTEETVATNTKIYEETININYEERKPSEIDDNEPKSKPLLKKTKLDDSVHQVITDTNNSISFKQQTPIVPEKLREPYEPKSEERSEPEREKPIKRQPTDAILSDDDDQITFETTTTKKDVILKSVDVEKTKFSEPKNREPSKPVVGKGAPRKPEADRSPTRKPNEQITVKTTTTRTTNIVEGKPRTDNNRQPVEPIDEPVDRKSTLDETKRVEELFKTTNKITNINNNYNEEFIAIESQTKETPDGAFFSKAPEPEPVSPSFKKKGVSPRETFEDRCRQILGMENYGDTPGSYNKKPEDESDEKAPLTENITKFEVKIEDCDDDEPNYLNNIKEALKPLDKPKTNKPNDVSNEELVEEVECIRKETVVPFKDSSPERKVPTEATRKSTLLVKKDILDEDECITNKRTSKVVKKVTKGEKIEYEEPEESSTSESESPEKETDAESQPDTVVSEREMQYTEEFQIEERTEKKQPLKPNRKLPGQKTTSPNSSPTRKTSEPATGGKKSPLKQSPSRPSTVTTKVTVESKPKTRESNTSTTRTVTNTTPNSKSPENPEKRDIVKKDKPISPSKTRPERVQKIDTPTTADKPHKKPSNESPNSPIKDRLRSSTRNKKPSITESDSSPEMSPTRLTERRRSSNISVHTEIIIDHTGPKSSKPTEKTPEKHKSQPKKTVPEDIISPTKPFRRFPVTERKESAPVPSVSRKDKDVKMTRSTSEKVMKVTEKPVKRTEVDATAHSPTPKTDRRPNKCFTTKTINLTTTDKLINSEDMENVIIDIQHAKSSREPSPDKIVPTPVPVHINTGKPRYPDVVQEPEDEPRKKPVIKNIPIFEEESNEFINCHISEVKTEKISKLIDLEEDDILDNPTIEAPQSLEYASIDRPDDDCLLSVHEKVSKFTHTAEEIKKPKASSPFSREFDKTPKVPDNDDCLLTVDEKVNKFIKTAEEVVKPITTVREIERPSLTDLDEELQKDDCTLTVSQKVNKFLSTAEKLAPTVPQRSPELVAKIERTISKQSEPEYPEDLSDDELTPFSQNHTIEIEKRRQKDILARPTVFEGTTKDNRNVEYVEEEVFIDRTAAGPESDEVIPHTRDHTTKIELKRQKDILSRPSIYDKNVKPRPQSPSKREPVGSCRPQHPITTNAKQTVYTTKKINLQDNEKIEPKSERKPSHSATKPENYKSPTKPQTSTVAVTRSRFETSDKKNPTSKTTIEPKVNRVPLSSTTGRKPGTDPKASVPSTTARLPSTTAYTKYPNSNRHKPLNEPNSGPRKQSTEPDSHYPERKPSAGSLSNVHDYETIESETEFTSTTRRRSSSKTKDYLETVQTEIERFSPTQKEPMRKIPSQEKQKPQTFSHSPTQKDTRSTITKVAQVTERTIEHSSPSDCSDIEIVETVPERPTQVKTPTSTPTIGRTRIAADTVAARRNIFESNATPKVQRPSGSDGSSSPVGRRPSYMDHTVSSLEHMRRDSLEVNKHNYSRKSSFESESNYERRPNAAVKFDVPQKPQRTASISEDIDVESIFELEVLERLLETVTSYELRRRIRAQIRLVKKNILNTEVVDKRKTETKTSKSISSTHKTSTYTSNVHHEETDTIHEDLKTKRPYESKPSPKRPTPTTKSGRVSEIEDIPRKSPYDRNESPKPYGKFRREEEVTTKTTTNAKIQNGRSESPKRPTKTNHERQPSPETKSPQGSVKGVRHRADSSMSSTHKEFIRSEQRNFSEETFNSSRSERFEKEESRERSYSPESKSPTRDGKQSPDYKTKPAAGTRTKSPEARKPSFPRSPSPQGRTPKQRDELYTISKVTTVKTTRSPERKSSKPTVEENAPIWVDRKNLLKSPSSTPRTPRKAPAVPSARTTATKATTKTTSQRQAQNRNFEEDSITSSYGIGPTDENGLPLFGIKALKKKKPSQPCEATEEVTGYVIEEKYYSDNKTKPKVERKEYIYSTNADELEEIKKTVEQSRKSSQNDVDVIRKFEKIDKDYVFETPEAIQPDSEDFTTSSKYVRRGSVKELSEKFVRKESSQSTTEKSGGYPKAGLILRTSRAPSTDPSGDAYETTTEKYTSTSRSGHGYRSTEADSDDEHNVQLRQKQSRRIFTEGTEDNESDQCHLSTRSSTKSTRSFLNSSGETKVVTSVDDALERMRNADYVVEAGDTAEDREARSLLNKFLGASVIMRGVESVLPTTKQTTTTTITKTSYADDDDDSDLLKNKALKTTRITKTTKSGSSSTPVTRKTCDIEEIWDEEILKELRKKI